jgi:hypothetical protein
MSCSLRTTSWIRLSTNGRAMLFGTGVTSPTQWLDRDGVSSGSVTIRRRLRCATSAYRCIMSRYVSTSGPPMSNPRFTSAGIFALPTR